MTYDPVVLTQKHVFLQRIADYVRLGYRHWTSGEVAANKAKPLIRKFETIYGIGQTRHQRAYARAKGGAGAVLLLYAPSSGKSQPTAERSARTADVEGQTPEKLYWVLVVSIGAHLAQRLERLQDATVPQGRIRFTGYELVQLPRRGQASPAWTWRMSDDTYFAWRARVIQAARRRPEVLADEIARLARTPGFAGCRTQVKKLLHLAKGESRRRYPDDPPLRLPRVRYVQRLPNGTQTLSGWLRSGIQCRGAGLENRSPGAPPWVCCARSESPGVECR